MFNSEYNKAIFLYKFNYFIYNINMTNITANVIKEFAKDVEATSFNQAYSKISEIINISMQTIMQRNSYISKYEILVANEAFSKSAFFASGLDLFLVVNAVQIELNQTNTKTNNFINWLKMFWQSFKNNFILFRSKKRKNEKFIKNVEKKALSLNNYDVTMFYNDLLAQISKELYNKTTLCINKNKIQIIGEDEFGLEINIYPVFSDNDEKYTLYNVNKHTKCLIDFKDRFINIDIKNIQTDNKFSEQVKIFNNLYWNILKSKPNQIFIESLLYNCPNNLFTNDDVESTINLVNYIKNNTMRNIKSICDETTDIFKESLNTTNFETALKFISLIEID